MGRLTRSLSDWIALLLIFLTLVGYTWALWRYFTRPVPGGNDFLTHYGAWDAYLRYGQSPYSEEAAHHTQRLIYGRPALPGEDQNRMVYPFYSILLHGPFVYIDYDLSRAIYMVLLQVALFVGVLTTLDLVRWRPPAWLLGFLLVWSLLFYPVARGVILGQFAIFGFFSLAAALYFLKRRRDGLAGLILVLATIKPTLVFLVIPFLMFWALFKRRWRFLIGFVGLVLLLTLAGMLVYPEWVMDWIYRVTRYSEYTVGQSPVWLLTNFGMAGLGQMGEWLISGLLLVGMLFSWWLAVRPGGEKWFYWSLGITLVISNLVVPRSATTNYVLMLIPTLWVFAVLDRTPSWGRPVLLLTMLVSFVSLWWLHYATVLGNQEQPVMFIPYPLALGLVLVSGWRWLVQDAVENKLVFI